MEGKLGQLPQQLSSTEEAKREVTQPFKYAYVEDEMITYIKELFSLFAPSEDLEASVCVENKNFLVLRIQNKLKDNGITIEDKDFIGMVLEMLRIVNEIVEEENINGSQQERDMFLYLMASTFYKVGIEAYTMEENSIPGLATAAL